MSLLCLDAKHAISFRKCDPGWNCTFRWRNIWILKYSNFEIQCFGMKQRLAFEKLKRQLNCSKIQTSFLIFEIQNNSPEFSCFEIFEATFTWLLNGLKTLFKFLNIDFLLIFHVTKRFWNYWTRSKFQLNILAGFVCKKKSSAKKMSQIRSLE